MALALNLDLERETAFFYNYQRREVYLGTDSFGVFLGEKNIRRMYVVPFDESECVLFTLRRQSGGEWIAATEDREESVLIPQIEDLTYQRIMNIKKQILSSPRREPRRRGWSELWRDFWIHLDEETKS